MSEIEELAPEGDEYSRAVQLGKPKKVINYRELAKLIIDSEKDTIFKIQGSRGSVSNIKVALQKRNLTHDKEYRLTSNSADGKGVIYITVKE